eukprot:scaffold9077_cov151-Skeletonema_dohrnii-CCMP3373.AAC.3
MEALDIAAQLRRRKRQGVARLGGLPSIADNVNDDDDEVVDADDIFDLDQFDLLDDIDTGIGGDLQQQHQHQQGGTTSRYQSDFVELQHLGKGGGGEVVKAINRLDRREYAIKKIFLEPEEEVPGGRGGGNNVKSKLAMIQNEKLRREVVTISRMTHKNIVRYYQAWVEDPPRIDEEEEEEGGVVVEKKKRRESVESKSQATTEKGNDNDDDDNDDDFSTSEGKQSNASTTRCITSTIQIHNTIDPLHQLVSLSLGHHSITRITHSLRIHPILRILACSGRIKAMSGVLESSHCALSIGCSFEAKYRYGLN